MQLKYDKQVNVAIFSRSSLLLLMEDTVRQKPLSCVSHTRMSWNCFPTKVYYFHECLLTQFWLFTLNKCMYWHQTSRKPLPRSPLQLRHNGRDSASNHQPQDCLLNRLFGRRSKKTSKLRVIGLCAGNSPVTGEFPAQMASNAENVSIWWRHHAGTVPCPQKPLHSNWIRQKPLQFSWVALFGSDVQRWYHYVQYSDLYRWFWESSWSQEWLPQLTQSISSYIYIYIFSMYRTTWLNQ